MPPDLPPQLEPVRRLLATSLRLRKDDPSPPVPAELMKDLARPGGSARTRTPRPLTPRWHVLSSPAFGLAAAALLILAFVAPALLKQAPETRESFRGSTRAVLQSPTVTLVLVAAPADAIAELESSGAFDLEIISAENPEAATALPGRRVIVDFTAARLVTLDASGTEIASSPLATDDLAGTVAAALAELD